MTMIIPPRSVTPPATHVAIIPARTVILKHVPVDVVALQKDGPFDLYDRHMAPCGHFVTLDLAVACARVIEKFCGGPCVISDRRGLPVYHTPEANG